MYQIFVVEDELLIRQNIRQMIEKMAGPYVFCGEASDGEMALSIMQEVMPDILLTDIRMPFLDGFGLIRHAKAMMPWLKVAIISGYGDFEYAQKAIGLGVNHYLLKPVRQADLVRVIGEMAQQIDREKAAGGAASAGLKDEEVLSALRREFLSGLLYDEPDLGRMLEKAQSLKMDIIKSHYLVVIFSFDSSGTDPHMLKRTVQKTLDGGDWGLYLFNTADQMTLMACDSDKENLNERVYQLISILRHELQEICPVITVVIGQEASRLGEISKTYHAAASLMRAVRNICAGKVINMNDASPEPVWPLRITSPFDDSFRQKLQYAVPGDVDKLVDEVMCSPDGEKFDSMLVRYHALYSLIDIALSVASGSDADKPGEGMLERLGGRFDLIAATGSREGFRDAARKILDFALRARDEGAKETDGYRHVIARAEKYARENCCDPNISLNSTARHVGMSAAYFSTIFSQTTGQSFIAFLTGLRIERAKELLAGTDRKLSEIAMDIGYNEPNYFSHVFRKTVGMTPKEYRARHAGQ